MSLKLFSSPRPLASPLSKNRRVTITVRELFHALCGLGRVDGSWTYYIHTVSGKVVGQLDNELVNSALKWI